MRMLKLDWSGWRRAGAVALLACLAPLGASGTSYEPPSFAELSRGADRVVRGRVLEVRSYRTSHAGQPLIETEVRLALAADERGPRAEVLALTMLGGRVGDEVLQVDAMPELAAGEDVILFVHDNGRAVCPILGWSHGAFRVRPASADRLETVVRWNGEPLGGLAQVQDPLDRAGPAALSAPGLSPDSFLAAVRREREARVHAR